jgi:hypothetical protein
MYPSAKIATFEIMSLNSLRYSAHIIKEKKMDFFPFVLVLEVFRYQIDTQQTPQTPQTLEVLHMPTSR